ncbi:hypothetical protein A4S06_08475 [Erysipelotrichaceae bacterium MTC7]|nr:hypothetical protein A4S06_08475 [Erysipelotrichaceae bacterium MTC7]
MSQPLVSGSAVAVNRFNAEAYAKADTYEHMDMQFEYASPETIKKQIKKEFANDNMKVLDIVSESERGTDAKLHDVYRVETVALDSPIVQADNPIAENVYMVYVQMTDTKAPIIKAKDIELHVGDTFDIHALEADAYDIIDGSLTIEVVKNDVDTATAGTYEVILEATDANHNTSRKVATVTVIEEEEQEQEQVEQVVQTTRTTNTTTPTYTAPTPTPALDRNNLSVRGWKVVVGSDVSDGVIRSYMSELQNLPAKFNNSNLHTIMIDNSFAYPYLGMAYSDGRLWLNGSAYYATTALHEMTHMYDYANNASAGLEAIFQAEKNNLPAKFSGNMRDNRYEWLANLVVYYYYDQATLRAAAPQSFAYIQSVLN